MKIYFKIPSFSLVYKFFDLKNFILLISVLGLIPAYLKLKRLENELKIPNAMRVDNDPQKPIIFVGGVPRSGSNVMKLLLDAHHDIQCADETQVFPSFFANLKERFKVNLPNQILHRNGITRDLLDSSARAFIYEILHQYSNYSSNICVKERAAFAFSIYLSRILPTSKFILMIRDPRSVALSLNQNFISSFTFREYYFSADLRGSLITWNGLIDELYGQCSLVGPQKCLPVYYEQLVLHPEREMKIILKFLNIKWNDTVKHIEKILSSNLDIKNSNDRVIKKANKESLYDWQGRIPLDISQELDTIAPMMKKLGYDTKSERPDYKKPDQQTLDKNFRSKEALEELTKKFYLFLNTNVFARNITIEI